MGRMKETQKTTEEKERVKVPMVHLTYSGLKQRVVFSYRLHRQTTCEHLDINRYEKGACICICGCVCVCSCH